MTMIRGQGWMKGGALALAALLAVSAAPADARVLHRYRAGLAASAPAFSAFTPAAADPRLASAFSSSGLGSVGLNDDAFRFTPSGASSSRRAITVAVRSRAVSRQQAARILALPNDSVAPSGYSLGTSIGWQRFALAGDVQKIDNGLLLPGRQAADLGLIFSGRRWATELQVAADRASGPHLPAGPDGDQSFSVGLGGSYALTHRLNVTGGIRYKQQREQLESLTDDRRDSQAVYLGTTFKF